VDVWTLKPIPKQHRLIILANFTAICIWVKSRNDYSEPFSFKTATISGRITHGVIVAAIQSKVNMAEKMD
jgi:hypothetical protein